MIEAPRKYNAAKILSAARNQQITGQCYFENSEAIPPFMMKKISISSASELLDDNQNTKNFLNKSPLVYLTGLLTRRTLC
jgi:hypothetical protein